MKIQLKKMMTAVLLTFALGICQNPLLAQTATPIKFARGKTAASVAGRGKQVYTLRVGAGQSCKILLVSAKNAALLEVLDAEGMDLTEGSDGRSFEGSFENAADLKIKITSKNAFTLKISIK